METHLSPRQVAEALNVSESSVKRWCDSGVIPTIKTAGGHRRIPLDGLLSFLESTNRRVFDPAAIGIVSASSYSNVTLGPAESGVSSLSAEEEARLRDGFHAALVEGEESTCRQIVLQWYQAQRGMAAIADELISRTMQRVGAQWSCEEIDIYQERRGCEICARLIQELRRLAPEPTAEAPLAIGATPSADPYSLPGQLIELVLREAGWRASNLGSNIPFASLAAAVEKLRPKLVWLSVSHIEDEERFVQECCAFASALPREVPFVVGGRALDDRLRPRLKFTAHCDTLQQLTNFAMSIRGYRPTWSTSQN